MIPAIEPYEAVYRRTLPGDDPGSAYFETLPVIAWDAHGHPLVAGPDQLHRADELAGFREIQAARGRVVAALPGGGWHVRWTDVPAPLPVPAWLVYESGQVLPVDVDSHGVAEVLTDTGSPNWALIPPAAEVNS
jgi:hypothetical protein